MTASVVHVIEDDDAFRDALVLTLASASHDVRSHADARHFLRTYDHSTVGCLVTDVRMAPMSGLELQQALLQQGSTLPIVFMTGHGDVAMCAAALKCGALDFLEKPFAASVLLRSVDEALARDMRTRHIEAERCMVAARYARLTERECRVMEMVIADRSNKEIARVLQISPRTVDHHREHVMEKMEANSLHDLIVMGLMCGVRELRLRADAGLPADR